MLGLVFTSVPRDRVVLELEELLLHLGLGGGTEFRILLDLGLARVRWLEFDDAVDLVNFNQGSMKNFRLR